MQFYPRGLWVAAWVSLLGVSVARADEPAIKQLYGGGVHAYFAKDFKEAHELLSSAIASKTDDPRVYFYRGLALWQLGRPDEAKQDFAAGATMEATASDDLFNIDKALERVQGKSRLAIEDARRAARAGAVKRRKREEEERYNRIRDNEPNILVLPPSKQPVKQPEVKKPEPADPEAEPKKEPAPNKTAGAGDFDPLRESPLAISPKVAAKKEPPKVAGEPMPKEPGKEPAPEPMPKVAEKVVPRPATPPGQTATAEFGRILGRMAGKYLQDAVNSVKDQVPPLPIPGKQ